MKTTSIFILAVLFIGYVSIGQESDYSFKESFVVSSPVALNVSLSDGFIKVYPSDKNQTDVYFIVKKGDQFKKTGKEELAEYFDIITKQNANQIEISVKDRMRNWRSEGNKYNVSCEIYSPVETSCDLRSSDGDIKIKGLKADQKCRTSDGDIHAAQITGQLSLTTSDGDIGVYSILGNSDLTTSDGDIKAEDSEGDNTYVTSDGDIDLYNISGAFTAHTSDGDISFADCSGAFSAQTSDGDIKGNLLKLKNKLSLITSDGDIEVTIPDGLGLHIKLKGSYLNVPLSDFSGKTEEHLVEGTIRGGGIPVELLTSDGRVSLSFK